jgi:DNA-binding CsgD family transcriptional regulator
LECR